MAQAPCIGLYKPCTIPYLLGTVIAMYFYPQGFTGFRRRASRCLPGCQRSISIALRSAEEGVSVTGDRFESSLGIRLGWDFLEIARVAK